MSSSGSGSLAGVSITEVRGQAEVLACAPTLVALAERCGQRGVVDHLAFQLAVPYFGAKLPSLFLLYPPRFQAHSERTMSVKRQPSAAVLLHEYRLLGLRTKLYIPSDMAGDWTVLAPVATRAAVAAFVGNYLLDHGARIAGLSFTGSSTGSDSSSSPSSSSGSSAPHPSSHAMNLAPYGPVAIGRRSLLRTLHLGASLDATLSAMGARTRRNLRLARRQAEVQLGATFDANARLSEEEFLAINRQGFYPVPDRVARWRFRSAHQTPGGFIAAARTGEGDWIALLGGRRYLSAQGSCTAVDWQLNHTRFARVSPGSLMRILLIEHEISRGVTQLRFEGGTPHSMRSAFPPEFVVDLLFAAPYISPRALRLLGRVLPKGNLLGDLLSSTSLTWST